MYSVQMSMHSTEKLFEILPNDVEYAELMVEDLVSQILLDLFASVMIDQVSICFSSDPSLEQLCSVQIQARCVSKSLRLTPKELENLELTLENRVSCALVQLLGVVDVEGVAIGLLSPEEGEDVALPL
jgi:hypothetical protein